MLDIKNDLWWEKHRPKKLEDIVLLDRIRDYVKDGIKSNMIFTGTSGLGKTTLARILVENYPCLVINSKMGVDTLRKDVYEFCTTKFWEEADNKKLRIVYFEEFDNASSALQLELKSFIETYSNSVRFIATCNEIDKIKPAIISRMKPIIDFTPETEQESKQIRDGMLKRILPILDEENIKIPNSDLKKIILDQFPDFREIWTELQYFHLTGHNGSTKNIEDEDLYDIIINPETKDGIIWDYIEKNWLSNINSIFAIMGRPFKSYLEIKHPDKLHKLPSCVITLAKYVDTHLPNSKDPFITACSLAYEYNKILNS